MHACSWGSLETERMHVLGVKSGGLHGSLDRRSQRLLGQLKDDRPEPQKWILAAVR